MWGHIFVYFQLCTKKQKYPNLYPLTLRFACKGKEKYKIVVHATGSRRNFTTWNDFIEDYTKPTLRFYSSKVWEGDNYDVSIANPKLEVMNIQGRLYFAVSNHLKEQTQNFIFSFYCDLTWPGRVRFNRSIEQVFFLALTRYGNRNWVFGIIFFYLSPFQRRRLMSGAFYRWHDVQCQCQVWALGWIGQRKIYKINSNNGFWMSKCLRMSV